MEKIILQNISKKYPKSSEYIIEDLNLAIREKEFIALVGPSGSGKSTILRMIAGLETITDGELIIDGDINNDISPKDRNIAMVFQNYALFPHMSVADNIGYGLKVRAVSKSEREKKISRAAKILGLEDYLDRSPRDLSGGQMQRVALGRAIVRNANIFLMDEPLSNLDAKLRTQMREEIILLHQELDATFIYVTHDQSEAMTMADRIVVMDQGKIKQVGSPEEIYNQPKNAFVAQFMGSPEMNILPALYQEGKLVIDSLVKLTSTSYDSNLLEGKNLLFGIRPENIIVTNSEEADYSGRVLFTETTGADRFVHVELGEEGLVYRTHSSNSINKNDIIHLKFLIDKIHLFDSSTGQHI